MKHRKLVVTVTAITAAMAMCVPTTMAVMAAETPVQEEQAETDATLRLGDYKEEVAVMQNELIKLGFLDDVADGSFGNKTLEAVKAFQEAFALEATGEMTADNQDVLSVCANAVYTKNEEEERTPVETTEIFGLTVNRYDDGTKEIPVNTVSEQKRTDIQAFLGALTAIQNNEEEKPAQDIVWLLSVDTTSIPEGFEIGETIDLSELAAMALEKGETIELTDTNGNTVFAEPGGVITSNTGNLMVIKADYDTKEAIEEATDVSIEDLVWRKPGETWFRTMKYEKDEDGNIRFFTNSVSDRTMAEARILFGTMQTAFHNSTEIPVEESEAKEAKPEEKTDSVSNESNANTNAANNGNNTEPVYTPVIPQVQPTYNEPANYAPVPAPAPAPAPVHEHTWVPITTTVHHDAVTHQEPVYTVVHHDAITHEEPVYEEVPIYQTVGYIECTLCHSRIPMSCSDAEYFAWDDYHRWTEGGSTTNVYIDEIVGYETRQTGTQTIVDTPAYDETVTSYTTVTDSAAWDETVTTGYQCSSCGATQ